MINENVVIKSANSKEYLTTDKFKDWALNYEEKETINNLIQNGVMVNLGLENLSKIFNSCEEE